MDDLQLKYKYKNKNGAYGYGNNNNNNGIHIGTKTTLQNYQNNNNTHYILLYIIQSKCAKKRAPAPSAYARYARFYNIV